MDNQKMADAIGKLLDKYIEQEHEIDGLLSGDAMERCSRSILIARKEACAHARADIDSLVDYL